MIRIDGTDYDIPVVSLTRAADFLDRYATRTNDGVLHRILIGVYFNYKLKFGRAKVPSVYTALWEKLTEPVPYHTVTVPDEDGTYTFTAYFAGVGDTLLKDKAGQANYWKDLTVNFIAKAPARQ